MTAETSSARGEVVAWRVPVLQSPFGERLDHRVRDELVLVMHRGAHGWKAAGHGHARLARQIYVKDVEPLCAASYEVAVVGLSGGGWRTVWARSDDDVTHPAPQSTPHAEEQLTYKGVPIGPMQTFADIERQAIAPAGAAEDMVLDAIERRESSAHVGVDAPGSRAWMAEVCRAAALSLAAHGVRNDQLSKVADWIAQQPAPSAPARPKVGLVRAGDGTYYAFEKGQSEQPAAVDEVHKAIRKVRNIATGAAEHPAQGPKHADGMRRACNIIEAALAAQRQEPKS